MLRFILISALASAAFATKYGELTLGDIGFGGGNGGVGEGAGGYAFPLGNEGKGLGIGLNGNGGGGGGDDYDWWKKYENGDNGRGGNGLDNGRGFDRGYDNRGRGGFDGNGNDDNGNGDGGHYGHSYAAAILSKHNVHAHHVPSHGHIHSVNIDVPANILPVNFLFRSASSIVHVTSKHEGAKGSFRESQSKDDPHVIVHKVEKPIIQEVHEVISPFRKITQTIEPVKEELLTKVAKGQHKWGHGLQGGEGLDGGLKKLGGGLALGLAA